MRRKKLFGVNINLGDYSSFVETIISQASSEGYSGYVCVANVHMLMEAYHSDRFTQILNRASLVTPDGIPLRWALRFLFGIKQDRVAGMDLLSDLLIAAERQKIPVGIYGGAQEMLDKARVYFEKKYPGLVLAKIYSPPFRPLTALEDEEIIQMFNESGARLIFVVLGCPKQEKWMASMQNRIHGITIGIGAALPVLAGVYKRAPIWMQKSGLEWFYRLGQEPRRLFKRYATTNSLFLYLLLREKFRIGKNIPEEMTDPEESL